VKLRLHYTRWLSPGLQLAKEGLSTAPIVLGKTRSPGLAPFAIIRSRSFYMSPKGTGNLRPLILPPLALEFAATVRLRAHHTTYTLLVNQRDTSTQVAVTTTPSHKSFPSAL
jgi:hypothetical protein